MITVITPTTGKESLFNTIDSIKNQTADIKVKHIVIWDNKREGAFLFPDSRGKTKSPFDIECDAGNYSSNCIVIKEDFIKGKAAGSSLRSIGLMAADSEWVTFMDDDVMWDSDHLEKTSAFFQENEWGFCKRRIWTLDEGNYECLGVDNFESIGEEAKTKYKMVDNNCLFFKKRYGFSSSCLYRTTENYNDDRLMYNFLKKYAGRPFKTNQATVNQICPNRLIEFFRENCEQEN
jgi:glycosyltransferase involved in cell wall biosynthesis